MADVLASRWLRLGLVVFFTVCLGSASMPAQNTTAANDAGRELRELTAEIRQLRVALENAAGTQARTQVLGYQATLQQARLQQAAARVEVARKELEGISASVRTLVLEVPKEEAALAAQTNAQIRQALAAQLNQTRERLELFADAETRARIREAEAQNALQMEELRWAELMAKFEQVIKK